MPISHSPRRLWLDRISSVKDPRVEFSYPDGSPSQGPSLCLVDWGTNTPSTLLPLIRIFLLRDVGFSAYTNEFVASLQKSPTHRYYVDS